MARFNKKADGEHRVSLSLRLAPETVATMDDVAKEIVVDGREPSRGRAVDEMARRVRVAKELGE